MIYTINQTQEGDYEASLQFAQQMFKEFKHKNKADGINGAQALWLHHRLRAWDVSFMDMSFTVDIINMGMSGDVETACLSLIYGQPDAMTMPQHWLSQERINILIAEMKSYLGWP